jgi:hypothetical protein
VGLLIRTASACVAAVLASGCYDPELQDCTETCAARDECGPGQVCGADGFCAQPSVAGTCRGTPVTARLTIHIEHKGRVVIAEPPFSCESEGDNQTCTTMVPGTGTVALQAMRTDNDFDHWTTANCAGQPATCHVMMMGAAPMDVGVKFH